MGPWPPNENFACGATNKWPRTPDPLEFESAEKVSSAADWRGGMAVILGAGSAASAAWLVERPRRRSPLSGGESRRLSSWTPAAASSPSLLPSAVLLALLGRESGGCAKRPSTRPGPPAPAPAVLFCRLTRLLLVCVPWLRLASSPAALSLFRAAIGIPGRGPSSGKRMNSSTSNDMLPLPLRGKPGAAALWLLAAAAALEVGPAAASASSRFTTLTAEHRWG